MSGFAGEEHHEANMFAGWYQGLDSPVDSYGNG
jgi:hypothetical protein